MPLLGRASCRVTLHEEELALGWVAARAVGQLTRESTACQWRLALHLGACCLGGMARSGSEDYLLNDGFGLCRMLLEIHVECLAQAGLNSAYHLGVAEFGLGLALKLWLKHLYRDHGSETLAEVLGLDVDFHFLEHLAILGIFLQGRTQTAAESGEVSSTLNGIDIVDKRIDVLVERGVVGHCHLHRDVALVGADVNHIVDKSFLAGVDVTNKLIQTGAAEELLGVRIALLVFLAQVGENKFHTGIQVGEVTQASSKYAVLIDGGLGENLCVGMELHGSAVLIATIAYHMNIACGLAVGIFLTINLAATANLGTQIVLEGALVQLLVLVDGDTTTIVLNNDRIILGDGYTNGVAKASQCLVDRVVDHLAHEMMQTLYTGVANVHRWALAHCLKSLKHLNIMRRIL